MMQTLKDIELIDIARKKHVDHPEHGPVVEALCDALERRIRKIAPPKRSWQETWGLFENRRAEQETPDG